MRVPAAKRRVYLLPALVAGVAALGVCAGAGAGTPPSGGVVRVVLRHEDVDSLDPALSYAGPAWALLDTTCAVLLRSSGRSGLVPEVAAGPPRVSRDGRTYTFTLRRAFRFSDGTSVRASAFARAIERTLAPSVRSPWAAYTRDIVGAEQVLSGRATTPSGVIASGDTLTVRLRRPVPEFPARTTFLCAVPPDLPSDREGIAVFPAAGPYHVTEYRPGERAELRANPYYGGKRARHVDGFTVDLRAGSFDEVLDRVEGGRADWGWALPAEYFDPTRRLVEKYGVNRSRFFLRPGTLFRGWALNVSRPLFRDNPELRRAVSFAIDRSALSLPHQTTLTDQYLPPAMAAFSDARIYPLTRSDLRRARALARGHTRSGKAVLFTPPSQLVFAQSIRRDLALIGLDVVIREIPLPAYFGRLGANGAYDIGFQPWIPDFDDPYSVLNVLFDGRFVGSTNWARFDSPAYNRLLRRAARLQGAARDRAYGELDARLARGAAPIVAVGYDNEPTLVSNRLGCVRRSFELTSVCIES
jgi:ABC-type oligopeptide transport system substrate-binding subunit